MTTTAEKIKELEDSAKALQVNLEIHQRRIDELNGIIKADKNANILRLRKAHMREVTPQDKQDREDAARYREAKNNGRLRETLFRQIDYPSLWDGIADSAMEVENG